MSKSHAGPVQPELAAENTEQRNGPTQGMWAGRRKEQADENLLDHAERLAFGCARRRAGTATVHADADKITDPIVLSMIRHLEKALASKRVRDEMAKGAGGGT